MNRREKEDYVFERFKKEYRENRKMCSEEDMGIYRKVIDENISVDDLESDVVIWIENYIELNMLWMNEKERKDRRNEVWDEEKRRWVKGE